MNYVTSAEGARVSAQTAVCLPGGLIGLPNLRRFMLAPLEDSWPFLSLSSIDNTDFRFLVIQPEGLIPDYQFELQDEDAEAIGLSESDDVLVLNIVTVRSLEAQNVTVNLVGPLVLNRRSGVGKQVILRNYDRSTTSYPLIAEKKSGAA